MQWFESSLGARALSLVFSASMAACGPSSGPTDDEIGETDADTTTDETESSSSTTETDTTDTTSETETETESSSDTTESSSDTTESSSDTSTETETDTETDTTDTETDTTETETDTTDTETDTGEDTSTDTNVDPDDPSGTYLLAVETTLGPDLPLQWIMTVGALPEGEGWIADIDVQPLSLDVGSSTTPRELNGPVTPHPDVPIPGAGPMIWPWGVTEIAGANNPVTGSDITASVQLNGEWIDPDTACGQVVGQITVPLVFDLDGSTFAAVRLDDDGTDPQTLPDPVLSSCP